MLSFNPGNHEICHKVQNLVTLTYLIEAIAPFRQEEGISRVGLCVIGEALCEYVYRGRRFSVGSKGGLEVWEPSGRISVHVFLRAPIKNRS